MTGQSKPPRKQTETATKKPKLRHDVNFLYKKYDSSWFEFKTEINKNEIATILNITYNPCEVRKTEFIEERAQSIDYAKSLNTNMKFLDNYNPNYLNINAKYSADTILHHIIAKSLIKQLVQNFIQRIQQNNQSSFH